MGSGNLTPKIGKFRQQLYSVYKPIINAENSAPVFFLMSVVYLSIAGLLYQTTLDVRDISIDYTDCYEDVRGENCATVIDNLSDVKCECRIKFNLKENYSGDVFMYYGLTNFYQNHRQYVRSRDDRQLAGFRVDTKDLNTNCEPYRFHTTKSGIVYQIMPCGKIANSMFNDSLRIVYVDKAGKESQVELDKSDLVWNTDQSIKFNNPKGHTLVDAFRFTQKPPNWDKAIYNISRYHHNNGLNNADLIVWMRVAAFSSFLKLYGKLKLKVSNYGQVSLPAGNYFLDVTYRYPVKEFKGTKKVMLSTTTFLGGRNNTILYLFTIMGMISIITAIIMVIIQKSVGNSMYTLLNGGTHMSIDMTPDYPM